MNEEHKKQKVAAEAMASNAQRVIEQLTNAQRAVVGELIASVMTMRTSELVVVVSNPQQALTHLDPTIAMFSTAPVSMSKRNIEIERALVCVFMMAAFNEIDRRIPVPEVIS